MSSLVQPGLRNAAMPRKARPTSQRAPPRRYFFFFGLTFRTRLIFVPLTPGAPAGRVCDFTTSVFLPDFLGFVTLPTAQPAVLSFFVAEARREAGHARDRAGNRRVADVDDGVGERDGRRGVAVEPDLEVGADAVDGGRRERRRRRSGCTAPATRCTGCRRTAPWAAPSPRRRWARSSSRSARRTCAATCSRRCR